MNPVNPPRRARIALVTHGYAHGGGVPAVARWLAENLRAIGGYTVDVHDLATSRRDANSRRIANPSTWRRPLLEPPNTDSEVCRWGANAVELEFMRYRPRRPLTRALARYDLIQVVAGTAAWAGAVIGAGVPIVLQVATLARWERQSQYVAWSPPAHLWRRAMTAGTSAIERSSFRAVDAVLVENDAMCGTVRALGQRSVIKAPPGVDTEVFTPPGTGWKADGPLLSVCRLHDARKGLKRMIHAYFEIRRMMPDAPPLQLVGLGPIDPELPTTVRDFDLQDFVTFHPNVERPELVGMYRDASVFLQASYEEGLGLATLEAMACGLPVVATTTHGSSEVVLHDRTGLLISQHVADEPQMFATVIASVLSGDGQNLGVAGRVRCVEEFSTKAVIDRYIDTYDALLARQH